jgi:hypothetical protein
VDGTGLSRVDDPAVAAALLGRVNAMNAQTAIRSLAAAFAFAAAPRSASAPFAAFLGLFAVLYAARDVLEQVPTTTARSKSSSSRP